jgi:hypothetical protein
MVPATLQHFQQIEVVDKALESEDRSIQLNLACQQDNWPLQPLIQVQYYCSLSTLDLLEHQHQTCNQVNFAIRRTNSAIVVEKYMCVVYMLVIRALLLKPPKC